MVSRNLLALAVMIILVGCSGKAENGATLSEETVKAILQNCLEDKPLKAIGPILLKDKNQTDVTFDYEVNSLTGKVVAKGNATLNLDSKGVWYMTQVLSSYDLCERRLPLTKK